MLHMQTVNLAVSFDRGSVMRVAHQAGVYERREGERQDAATVSRDDE